MSQRQKRNGRNLFSFSPGGQREEISDSALSLLRAVGFALKGQQGSRVLIWDNADQAMRLLQCKRDALPKTEKAFCDLIAHGDGVRRMKAFSRMAHSSDRYAVSYRLQRQNRSDLMIEELGELVTTDTNIPYYRGVIRDISERRETRDQIEGRATSNNLSVLWSIQVHFASFFTCARIL